MKSSKEYEQYSKKAGDAAIGISHVLADYELNPNDGLFLLSHYLCLAAIKHNYSKEHILKHINKMYDFAKHTPTPFD